MSRPKVAQKRIGYKEARALAKLMNALKGFKIFRRHRSRGETQFNDWLINNLLQNDVAIENTNIHSAKFVGETFRPECYLAGGGKYPLCAIECKKLNDQFAKSRWKEGLSQALLYKHYYKAVAYVLYDFTTGAKYAAAFGAGNRTENQFAKSLREEFGVTIIVLKPSNNALRVRPARERRR